MTHDGYIDVGDKMCRWQDLDVGDVTWELGDLFEEKILLNLATGWI